MKRHLLFLFGLLMSTIVLADVPQGISHQAVMRDAENNLIVESPIGLRVSILQGAHDGEAVYVETHIVTTNANGLITYIIGEGDAVDGVFADIDWSDGPYWLETKADPGGGTDYSIIGITKFFSVPYSLYAEFAGHAQTFAGLDALLARIEALEEALDIDVPDGTVTDIDGNVYQTVIIGNQEWMAENLRVTRYNNEDDIPTGLSNADWSNTTSGAYAIYNNSNDMLEAYGKLYNWYAVDDERGLCPEGWSVPSDADWTALVNYVVSQGYPNEWNNPNGAGNALKSCRQVGHPDGGDCDTSEHPRWNSHGTHSGFDEFGFSALPGGNRWSSGSFDNVGGSGSWWSATEFSGSFAWYRSIGRIYGSVGRYDFNKRVGFSVRCLRDLSIDPTTYNINLEAHPENAGTVSGAGEYEAGELVNVTATANEGWEFINWTGETEHLDDADSAEAVVTMPAEDVNLTANFQAEDSEIIYGDGVTDIDGNEYITVIIGDQEWMAENLRVTKYNNGEDIPADLSATEWQNTIEGAYSIYPHEGIDDINSSEEVVNAYGKLYNWYAVDDSRGLCPEGWTVPSDEDWAQLIDYVVDQGFPNIRTNNGAGNALKSCRQVNHPDGGDCDTLEHPRWKSNNIYHGFDEFGFSALPGGDRFPGGSWGNLGLWGYWWSNTEYDDVDALGKHLTSQSGYITDLYSNSKLRGLSIRCIRDETEEPTTHNLHLDTNPENAGTATGAGEYEEGEVVEVIAIANAGWEFVNWTGDTDYIDNPHSENAMVTMPSGDVTLTANFQEGESDIIYGDGVTDIDGNEYITVIIGDQEWMAENLRVTRYNNEDDIPTDFNDEDWENTIFSQIGAYAIFDHNHEDADGINSPEEMVDAYGKLYNWYAVDDERALCPDGWSVPSDDDWTTLVNFIMDEYDYHNEPWIHDINGVANALKSCRQVESPLGGDCDTSEHPRWNSHITHYGFDEFGFSALPGGFRWIDGSFASVWVRGIWWSSTEHSSSNAWYQTMLPGSGSVSRFDNSKSGGLSLRCFRDIVRTEDE